MNNKKIFVLDTNVLLHSAAALESFADNEIVIPMTVLEELDKFKRNQDELGRNSRHVIRKLDQLREKGSLFTGVSLDNAAEPDLCGSVRVVISEGALFENADMSVPDNRILNVASMLKKQFPDQQVIFITKDINLRLKADAFGIKVQDFEKERVDYNELFTGSRIENVSGELIDQFHQEKSIAVPEGMDIQPNEFVLLQDAANSKHAAFGWRRFDRLEKLHDGIAEHVWNITPRSKEQRMALHLLMDPEIPLVTLVGKAGSGKTLLALAAALELTEKQNVYSRILVSRPIIPLGNDIGYLPGDKDEKLDAWMQPIYDNLEFLLRSDKRESSARRQIEEMKRNKKLELEALTYIRGRTIPNQFVIVDEAQNLTPHEVKTIVSRCGQGTKIVLTGDPDQIDNPYLDASSNGLTNIIEHMKHLPLSGHITLMKSERSPLAAAAAEFL
ncbi:MAG: PhoH family protein [Lentisphaeria bacterium]|nr:PhoH family protein [Lentisphaeria bacterium]MBR4075596.1 PhoH family protein [Lentisphaeria bacterium]